MVEADEENIFFSLKRQSFATLLGLSVGGKESTKFTRGSRLAPNQEKFEFLFLSFHSIHFLFGAISEVVVSIIGI